MSSVLLPIFELESIGVSFGTKQKPLQVLRDLSLTVLPGAVLGVIGPSGGGKTVLLKTMAGLIGLNQGSVNVLGKKWDNLQRHEKLLLRRKVAMTFQRSGLFDSMSCFENLDFPLRELTELSEPERREKCLTMLENVGLAGFGNHRVTEISGGMLKRLGIARGLILDPQVILYDDPTAGLDPLTSRSIMDLIFKEQQKRSSTVVFVTSDPNLALGFSNTLGVLYGGKFIEVGNTKTVKDSANKIVRQFLGTDTKSAG